MFDNVKFEHRGWLVKLFYSSKLAASNLPMPRNTLTRLGTANISRFLASHSCKMASVGLGRVAKYVT